jgi:glutathionylspermidine synthase
MFLVRFLLDVVSPAGGRADQVRYDGVVRGDSVEEVSEKIKSFGFHFDLYPIEESSIEDLPVAIRRHLKNRNVELALSAGDISPRQPPPCTS